MASCQNPLPPDCPPMPDFLTGPRLSTLFPQLSSDCVPGPPGTHHPAANYWAPLTRKRHTMPHSAQPQHTNYWAPRMRKRHQQDHWPQRPTESSDPTQHVKGRTGDRPGPRKGATTRRNVTQGGGGGGTCTSLNASTLAIQTRSRVGFGVLTSSPAPAKSNTPPIQPWCTKAKVWPFHSRSSTQGVFFSRYRLLECWGPKRSSTVRRLVSCLFS